MFSSVNDGTVKSSDHLSEYSTKDPAGLQPISTTPSEHSLCNITLHQLANLSLCPGAVLYLPGIQAMEGGNLSGNIWRQFFLNVPISHLPSVLELVYFGNQFYSTKLLLVYFYTS